MTGETNYVLPAREHAEEFYAHYDLGEGYSFPVDMWGCGVILYTLLVGFPPFWHSNRMVLMRLIMRGKFEFLSPYWDNVSDEAKDLVSKLLAADPKQRLTATEAIGHPWMVSALESSVPGLPRVTSRLKIAALAVMAVNRFKSTIKNAIDYSETEEEGMTSAEQIEGPEQVLASGSQTSMSAGRAFSLTAGQYPVSVTDSMYKEPRVRKAIDECAFRIYAHWVKKSNAQNRAALFENYLVYHTN
ncbi:hypothetical protein SARC_01965 [Sphaeroforma arctica JP610]|uniref:Protein kinase domain-containing protein n=1 Tax=Sphaeroforma arctica JP610 TaxID=667725 RepID=A0A0L0GAE6_9EUKA|nr:hypothetical protein SARC_01965 [Sphaeroforma arctica JP610]KNC85856.1 hypothetical protein SARC_01965 [Sphaeroforma arctica JP610]|eukprot:XP_014159758.1 hypothetical protein SARC_01965 [Sphaeroforma arctica JP610]